MAFVSPTKPTKRRDRRRSNPDPRQAIDRHAGSDTLYVRQGVVYINGVAQRQGFGAVACQHQSRSVATSPARSALFVSSKENYALLRTRALAPPRPPCPRTDSLRPLLCSRRPLLHDGRDIRWSAPGTPLRRIDTAVTFWRTCGFVYYSYRRCFAGSSCDGETSDRPCPSSPTILLGLAGPRDPVAGGAFGGMFSE